MAARPKAKLKAPDFPVPQSHESADEFIRVIGEAQRERARIEAEMNETIARAKAEAEGAAQPHKGTIEQLSKGVQVWCEAHRAELLKPGTKTYAFAAGEVSWRKRPPKVIARGIDKALDFIKRRGLTRFLRVKEELDKEALLKEPETALRIPGISIGSEGEDFIVKPLSTQLEEVAP